MHKTVEEWLIAHRIDIEKNFFLRNVEVTADAAELNKLDGVTASTAEINKLTGMVSLLVLKPVTLTETEGAGTYTGSVIIPDGGVVLDVIFHNTALWTAAVSAIAKVGDSGDDDGIFKNVDLKTDPALGTFISYQRKDTGVGDYLGTKLLVYPTSDTITAIVAGVGAGGGAGRTTMYVLYLVPQPAIDAVKS